MHAEKNIKFILICFIFPFMYLLLFFSPNSKRWERYQKYNIHSFQPDLTNILHFAIFILNIMVWCDMCNKIFWTAVLSKGCVIFFPVSILRVPRFIPDHSDYNDSEIESPQIGFHATFQFIHQIIYPKETFSDETSFCWGVSI